MRVVEVLFYDTNRVKLVVEMPDPDRCTTESAPHLPVSLFRLFPHLASHKCHNGNGYSFRREAMATEVPHLLEHLIIELQAQAQHHEVLKGETQWNWRVDPRGTFHVHVEYQNEQLVLAAIRLAEKIVNLLDSGQIDSLDIEKELERLRKIAALDEERYTGPPRGFRAPRPAAVPASLSLGKGGATSDES